MAEITAALVKTLREMTGAGMMDCKKALSENNGDLEASVDWLRTKGLAAAAKKSGRAAAEGLVAVAAAAKSAVVVEINAETDFVSRNDAFQALAKNIAEVALEKGSDIDTLKNAAYPNTGRSVEAEITNAIATIGENMGLRRVERLSVNQGVVATYIHSAITPGLGKIGVLVALESTAPQDALEQLGKQIAMHVAAARPEALTREEVSAEQLERERAVFKEQAIASGKPAEIAEKMVEGRIRKYYEEVVLPEQVFVMDGKTKISDVIAEAAKQHGADITLKGFARFQLGEGIEKQEDDFAAEVAKAAGM